MTDEFDEEQSLLEEISEAEYYGAHPWEGGELRCADCGFDFDGEAECERMLLRDGLCGACRKADADWRRRDDSMRAPRVVELGHWYEARFDFFPDRTLWVYSAKASEPMKLQFFDPDGFTDADLAKKLRVWITFS